MASQKTDEGYIIRLLIYIIRPGASEEPVQGAVRRCIDNIAPGGGVCFRGGVYGLKGDLEVMRRVQWIEDEYNSYVRAFYKGSK